MNDYVYQELSRAIQREGVGLAENPQRIKALLMDACPESRTEITLIVAAVEDGVTARLARASDSVFRDSEISRAISDLQRTRRLDDRAADWVVRSWAAVLGLGPAPSSRGDTSQASPVGGPPSNGWRPPEFASSHPSVGSSTPPPGSVDGLGGSPPSAPPPGSNPSAYPPSRTQWPQSAPAPQHPAAGQMWNQPPAGMGPPAGSWGGTPPSGPPPPGLPAYPTPPRRGRGRLFAILGGVAAVVALVVALVVVTRPSAPPIPDPLPSPSPSALPPATSGEVNFTIKATLPSFGLAETATVYSYGKRVGELTVNQQSPTDSFDVTTNGGGATDYQLQITIMLDDAQHTQGSVNGDGSITAFEGAVYSVQITEDQQGNLVATLSPEEGQGT